MGLREWNGNVAVGGVVLICHDGYLYPCIQFMMATKSNDLAYSSYGSLSIYLDYRGFHRQSRDYDLR